jgi:MATE family multidrug resistance protein
MSIPTTVADDATAGAPAPLSHTRELLRLALPITTVQVGWMLMGVVDTIVVGHLSATALAAVALGNLYWFMTTILGFGVLMAMDPIVSQAVGAGDEIAITRGIQRGLLLSVLVSAISTLLLLTAEPALALARQPAEVVPLAAEYARISIWGVLPFFVFVVLRQSLQAMGEMRHIVLTIVFANIVNAALDWILVFGGFGIPAMGVAGSAWATAFCRWLMTVALVALSWRILRPHLHAVRREVFDASTLWKVTKVGVPIGIQFQLEFSAFALIALLMGRFGTAEMAGHQIALNLASLTFMVPVGIAGAAAVLVGQAVGRGDEAGARASGKTSIVAGAAFMSISAAIMMVIPGLIARLYTSDPVAGAVAAMLIPIAGVFQIFDGVQAVSGGVLRGLGDTRTPMLVNIVGFWLIGIPVSLYLGFRTTAGPAGLWWGLVAGLVVVAMILLVRVRITLRRAMVRLVIDEKAAR